MQAILYNLQEHSKAIGKAYIIKVSGISRNLYLKPTEKVIFPDLLLLLCRFEAIFLYIAIWRRTPPYAPVRFRTLPSGALKQEETLANFEILG